MGWLVQPGTGWWRGPGGVRAGWRALGYVALVVGLLFAEAFVIPRGLLRSMMANGQLPPWFVLLNEVLFLVPVVLATAIVTQLEGRGFYSCGLAGERRLARFLGGAAAGLGLIFLLVLLVLVTGHAAVAWGGLRPAAVLPYALAWGFVSFLTGLTEELALRGYLLQALQRGLGFWPALAITSLIFGLSHISNSGENFIGIVNVVMAGAILALGVRGTGSLWWSIGLHGAWDYAENFLAGTPDSGQICLGTLLHTTPAGLALLSGGATGPEGSLFSLPLLAAALALAARAFARPRTVVV